MNEVVKERIENLIYEVRGMQVMLDSDLARLYECKNGTKEVNQAVSRNFDKFPERFSFVLTSEECYFLRSQIVTTKDNNISTRGGRRNKYRVFTEQGVAMLSTVLKSDIATKVSIAVMDAFARMRHYIGNTDFRLSNVESKIIELDENVKLLQESFKKLEEKKKVNEIYFNGQIYDAYSKILDIFKSASKSLIVIDGYADNTVLDIIKRLKVKVDLITKRCGLLTNKDIEKYNKQYSNLKVYYDNTFHDRYFIIDKTLVYHCGASINKIGYKTFSINLIQDSILNKLLIENVNKIINKI